MTRSVKMIKTFSELTRSLGSPGAESEMSIFGTVTASAPKAVERAKKDINATAFKMATLH